MSEPLSAAEQADVRQDLVDLSLFESHLASTGVRGLVVSCDDCGEDHCHRWSDLRANLLAMLAGDDPEPMESAAADPQLYVSWDFCRGYVAGVSSTQR